MPDIEILSRLIQVALLNHDGHLTIMRFTTNWRVSFETPNDYMDIQSMPSGETFAEAGVQLLDSEPHA